MFRNYLITAIRNISRQKGTTIINISGLALGITCSLVLFLLVRHLTNFDTFHANRDRIYRVVTESDGNNGKNHTGGIPSTLPVAFRNDFTQAEEVTFVSYRRGALISIQQPSGVPKRFNEDHGVTFAEANFFKIFDRPVLSGDPARGLDEPYEAIISKSLAEKYFDTSDAIGKVLKYDTTEYKVTAVIEDAPANTDLPFNLMLSYSTIQKATEEHGWGSIWSDEQCYVLLKDSQQASEISSGLPAFVDKYMGKDNFSNRTFHLQPLSVMHFDDDYGTLGHTGTTSKEGLFALSLVALFLIITACINFINLSTAEAIKRSKEVGIRKSLGSSRGQLIIQFLGETFLVTAVAMVLSVCGAQLLLSFLNTFLNSQVPMNFSSDGMLWLFIIGVTLLVALLSGLYPSIIISGYKPAVAMKNLINNKSTSGFNLRRGLVVMQFVISQFFIIGTIVLVQQMNYFQKKDLGFRKDAIIVIPIPEQQGPAISQMRTLREEVQQLPGVLNASLSNSPPSSGSVSGTIFHFQGEDESNSKTTQVKTIDGNYLQLFDLKLVAGNGLSDGDTATGFVVNEQLVKVAGFNSPDEIIGKQISMWDQTLPVVGVVKDFHTVSLERAIEPTVLMNRIKNYHTMSVLINPSQMQDVLANIKSKWESTYPEHLFDYQFLDEHIREFYEGEQKMSILISVFTSIAIFIGCLGLLGLATFMANQKTKEIGVRKVLGASVESIIILFTKEYVKLITIGFVIAGPLAGFMMNKWLENFAYKISIGPVIFFTGFVITLIIALATVGYKSLNAATVNPVNALKSE